MDKLIVKYCNGNYSKEELEEIKAIFESKEAEYSIERSMLLQWNNSDSSTEGNEVEFERILNQIHHSINLKSERPSVLNRFVVVFSRVAAILIIPLFVALFVLLQHNLPNTLSIAENTVSVPRGAFSQLELPDGTQVWLNSGSTLKYPLSFRHQTHRKVSLQGEGFFKVKKDKSTPFIVNMKGVDIRVTGTTFNARAYSDETDVTVALVEGSVLLGYPDRTDGNKFVSLAGLKPMQVAVMNKTTCRLELTNTQDMEKYIAWTKGRTMFEDDPIETLIEKFEKLYNIHVVIADKALLQYRFTATFDNESLERAIKIISLSSPISFEIVNGKKDSSGAFVQRTLILRIDKHSSRTHQPVIL